MKFGLSQADMQQIVHAVQQFPQIEGACIFGSRAKGNYKPGSDVDIAISGEKISPEIVTRLGIILNEETRLPYFIDIVHIQSLADSSLKEHIQRVGQWFYKG
jgi:predicted nucleotidyltransferase